MALKLGANSINKLYLGSTAINKAYLGAGILFSGGFSPASLFAGGQQGLWLEVVQSGEFYPASLFAGGIAGAWYDPSDLSTLFQDSAGTTPVTASGQPVGLMLDKSGNGNHATQAAAAARPTYTEGSGLSWLAFDGVDDEMDAVIGWDVDGPVYMAIAGSTETTTSNLGFLSVNPGSTVSRTRRSIAIQTGTSLKADARGGNKAIVNIIADSINVIEALFEPDSSTISAAKNGASYTTVSQALSNTSTSVRFGVGVIDASTQINLYGAILRNVAPDASNRASVASYLANKSGVTL